MSSQLSAPLDSATIREVLQHGTIQIEGLMPYSSNYTLLTVVEYANQTVLAIYKPRRGERPLWDFPRGTLYQREVAASVVSDALQFSLVPPTITREGPYGIGSLQLFVEHDPDAHLFTMMREPCYAPAIQRLAAFDCLINNADRKSGHCLKGNDGHLWSIDHGICFHAEDKLRTVLWDFAGEPLPPDIIHAFERFRASLKNTNDTLRQTLTALLNRAEMRALSQRLHELLSTGVYPYPSATGPHIPWPPV